MQLHLEVLGLRIHCKVLLRDIIQDLKGDCEYGKVENVSMELLICREEPWEFKNSQLMGA